MEKICLELKRWGCDMGGAMERFADDEELYLRCLNDVLSDENFEKLGKALKEDNATVAFDCAHTLKGVVANMGLTPIYDAVVKIVEPLRRGSCDNLYPFYMEVLETKKHLEALVEASCR